MPRWRRLSFKGGEDATSFFSALSFTLFLSPVRGMAYFHESGRGKTMFLIWNFDKSGRVERYRMIQGGTKSGRKFEIQFLSIILVDKFRRHLTLHRPNFPPLFPPSISKLFITFFVFTIKIFETRNLYIYIYIERSMKYISL